MRFANVVHLDPLTGQRRVARMRWGWPDARNQDPRARPRHLHARAETIDALPSFSGSFADHRGLIFVSAFNVGEELPNGKVRQWRLTRPEHEPMALGVIWEAWQIDANQELLAYVMVTTAANELIATKTDRMPAIIAADDIPLWLGEVAAQPRDAKALLKPFAGALVLTDPNPPKPKREPAAKRQRATEPTLL
jgi:putative SOS response-associated peptidase YedK